MKFLSLSCPYCDGQINLFEDHKFGECIHCGRKVMLINDEVKRDERNDSTYPEFESVRYLIEASDVSGGSRAFAERYRNNPSNPHGWLLCGYLQLMGCRPLDDSNILKKMMKIGKPEPIETRLQSAFSSWKRAFSVLDNQYYLIDYCKAIGLALSTNKISSSDSLFSSDEEILSELSSISGDSVIPHLDDIKDSIESHFNISFSADFYYYVLVGYLRRKGLKKFYKKKDLAFALMTRAILYERDVDALVIKSQLLNNEGLLDKDSVKKDKCVFFLLSLIYKQMSEFYTDQQKSDMLNSWTEKELYSKNNHKWKSIMSDDTYFYGDDLKYLMDNINQFITFGDEDDDDESDDYDEEEEEMIDLKKYEGIVEEHSLKLKLSKKRLFTQYIVIDGTLYARSLELSRNEFDGDVGRKSDFQKLKTMFENEYEDIIVGADNYYTKYTLEEAREYLDDDYDDEDDDDDYEDDEIDEELVDFFDRCIEFTNILESKIN